MNKPGVVSIIVPVFNCESYLEKCLDSILNQTYKNLEIIVINDGSTDNSGRIIRKYADNNTNILPLDQKNSGVSAARNRGIEKARLG